MVKDSSSPPFSEREFLAISFRFLLSLWLIETESTDVLSQSARSGSDPCPSKVTCSHSFLAEAGRMRAARNLNSQPGPRAREPPICELILYADRVTSLIKKPRRE